MNTLTVEKVKVILSNGFDEKSIEKFNKFLEERNQTDLYYNAVAKSYNREPTKAEKNLNGDVACAFRNESELGSCFVTFDASDEGRKFWTEFNRDWQIYRVRVDIYSNSNKTFSMEQVLDLLTSMEQAINPELFKSSNGLDTTDFLDLPRSKASELGILDEFETYLEADDNYVGSNSSNIDSDMD